MNTSPEAFPATCEDKIKASPLAAVGLAFGAGIVLTRLPVLSIGGLVLRVALSLVKPALLVLGAMKACDLARNGCCRSSAEDDPLGPS